MEVKLDSENGSSAFMVKDSTSTAVASMDSAGNLKIKNKAANSQLSLSGNNIIQSGGDFSVNSAAGETWFQTMGTTRLILGGGGNVGVGIYPSQKLSVAGTIESTLGGVKFPDGTIQTTSSGVKGGGWIKGGGQVTLETTTDNVGIGTTNPAQKLSVAGMIETTSGGIKFPNGSIQLTALSTMAAGGWIKGGGRITQETITDKVGIGTANPKATLNVSSTIVGISVETTDGNAIYSISTNGTGIYAEGPDYGVYGKGNAGVFGDGTAGAIGIYGTTDTGYAIYGYSSNTGGYSLYSQGVGKNYFQGNVGIGLLTPLNKVHISQTSGSGSNLVFPLKIQNPTDEGTGRGVGVQFATGSGGDARGKGAIAYTYGTQTTWNRGDFHFLQNSIGDASNPTLANSVMTVTNVGKVGIGKTNPLQTLDVDGNALISGTIGVGTSDAKASLHIFSDIGTNNILLGNTTVKGLQIRDTGIALDMDSYGQPLYINNASGKQIYLMGNSVGIGMTGGTLGLEVSGGTRLFDDVYMPNVYSHTTLSSPNMYIDSNGWLYRSSSSRRYKTDIRDYSFDISKLNELKPVRFKMGANTGMPGKEDFGLIAEDVFNVFPELVEYNINGQIEGLQYPKLAVILLKAYQEKEKESAAQKTKIEQLESRLKALEEKIGK